MNIPELSPELAVIGLTCNVVGVFFLANSIRFREPRKALEDALGVGGRSLLRVRDTALNNMQVIIGFLFLTTGFLLQVVAQWDMEVTTLAFCAGIMLFAGAVYAIGAYSSRRAFKKLLREYFQNADWSFADDMALTKEIGALAHSEEDVLSYVMFPAVAREFFEWRERGDGLEEELIAAIATALAQEQSRGHEAAHAAGNGHAHGANPWKLAGRNRSMRGSR